MFARTIALAGLLFASTCALAADADAIVGIWQTHEGGYVQIYKDGDVYEGVVVGGDAVGTTVIKELEYGEGNVWEDGRIYDPEADETYDLMATLKGPEELKITGYLGFPSMGKSFIWTAASPDAEGVQQDALQ